LTYLGNAFTDEKVVLRSKTGLFQRYFFRQSISHLGPTPLPPCEHPPANLLRELAALLGVSTDELLGMTAAKKKKPATPNHRLQRRLQQVEKLPARDKRQLIQIIDTFVKAAQVQESA